MGKNIKSFEREYIRRQKISESSKNKKLSEEHKKKIGLGNKGKKISKEAIMKRKKFYELNNKKRLLKNNRISNSLKGYKQTFEHREKTKRINIGRKQSKETIEKRRLKLFGHKVSEGTIERIKEMKGKTWEEIYGKEKSKELKINLKKHRANQILPIKDTSIEVKIQKFLKELNIEFFTHQYMKIKHGYQCDILIPSLNLVIECDGDYWHKYPIGLEKDHIRTKELIEKGFKVLRLWENEIKVMELNDFKGRLNIK